MDLDMEDSWLNTCIGGGEDGPGSVPEDLIPDIPESEVTSEIEKLTSGEDLPSLDLPATLNSQIEEIIIADLTQKTENLKKENTEIEEIISKEENIIYEEETTIQDKKEIAEANVIETKEKGIHSKKDNSKQEENLRQKVEEEKLTDEKKDRDLLLEEAETTIESRTEMESVESGVKGTMEEDAMDGGTMEEDAMDGLIEKEKVSGEAGMEAKATQEEQQNKKPLTQSEDCSESEHDESGEENDSADDDYEERDSVEELDTDERESGDERESIEDENYANDDDDDDASSKASESSAVTSQKMSEDNGDDKSASEDEKTKDDGAFEEDHSSNILEPACELAEQDDYEHGLKSRFNLRKRSHVQVSNEGYESDDYDPEVDEEPRPRKLKFNFGKKNYRRQRPYTNEAVKEAVKMVQTKKMSILEASRQFDIPRTSLHNFIRLYKRGRRMGVRTISPGLTKQEEAEMVSLVIKLSRCGKRYSHNELRFLIQYYLMNNDRPVFKSGTLPTMGWIAGLVERQPDLTKAKSKKNTKVAAEDVEEWQKQIEDYLINDWDLDIDEIFRHENGHRIFCFNAFKMTVNGPAENSENKPSPVKKEPGTEEEKDHELSAILGMSANGNFVVPLVVLAEENRELCPQTDPNVLRILFNKTGRVDEDVALRVVRDFDQDIVTRGIPKPVVFFVNDKQDMAHFSVIEYCWENQIVIICLPPKTCKTMTPFEVSIWPKIRSSYAMLWKNAPKAFENKISVQKFPELFVKAWETASVPKQAVRGFVKSGLIPLDVPAILGDNTAPLSSIPTPSAAPSPHTEDFMEDAESRGMAPEMEDSIPDELSSLEDRSRGKLEGIQMCLEAIESFIPPDVIPVWNERGADYRGRCELAFKLWRSVSLLLKAGCAMASIQQMAEGFFNPFASDFATTASFFQKTPLPNIPSNPKPENPTQPNLGHQIAEKPTPKKRKLNKSIYSNSAASVINNGTKSGGTPFVKIYQNPYIMQADLEREPN